MSKRGSVSWVKPSEPSFLRKFKSDVGFKEGPTVDTKRQEMPAAEDDSGDSEREDEKPQVVALEKRHLTAEEVKHIKDEMKGAHEDQPPPDGKILFKKPAKRSSEKLQNVFSTSSKKKKACEARGEKDNSQKKVKNSSLLSFGEEDED